MQYAPLIQAVCFSLAVLPSPDATPTGQPIGRTMNLSLKQTSEKLIGLVKKNKIPTAVDSQISNSETRKLMKKFSAWGTTQSQKSRQEGS